NLNKRTQQQKSRLQMLASEGGTRWPIWPDDKMHSRIGTHGECPSESIARCGAVQLLLLLIVKELAASNDRGDWPQWCSMQQPYCAKCQLEQRWLLVAWCHNGAAISAVTTQHKIIVTAA